MRLALLVALTLMVLAMGCDAVLGIDLTTYRCEELKDRVIELSEEQQSPFSPIILKVSEIEETSRTDRRLDCYGIARLNNGAQEGIVFHIEEDADGDFFYGYEAGSKPIQRDPTPIPNAVRAIPPSPEKPTSTALPTSDQQNPLPTQLSTSTPVPSLTPQNSETPDISATVEAHRATLVAAAATTPSTPDDEVTPTATVLARAAAPCCASIGSIRDDVLGILGEPDSDYDWGDTLESTWYDYNTSISFSSNDERVVSWIYTGRISDSPFAILNSISNVPLSNPGGLISVGSTANEVFGVVGDPDQVWHWGRGQEVSWSYYNADVSFDAKGERVVSWFYTGFISDSPFAVLNSISSAPLSDQDGLISVGSTANEVFGVVGDPDQVWHWGRGQEVSWSYYNADVSFDAKGERVVSWFYTGFISDSPFAVLNSISSAPLSNPNGFISVGSTANEVFEVLGDPDQIWHWGKGQEITWSYYNASVSFDTNGERVTDWYYDGPEDESPFR